MVYDTAIVLGLAVDLLSPFTSVDDSTFAILSNDPVAELLTSVISKRIIHRLKLVLPIRAANTTAIKIVAEEIIVPTISNVRLDTIYCDSRCCENERSNAFEIA